MNPLIYQRIAEGAGEAIQRRDVNSPDIQRNLSLAILRARPSCCKVCDALLPMQDALFQAMEQTPEPAAAPDPNEAGGVGDALAWPDRPPAD